MKHLRSLLVIAIITGLLSGCADAPKGKKKKHAKSGKTTVIELRHQVVA